jgi:hypothetical protein
MYTLTTETWGYMSKEFGIAFLFHKDGKFGGVISAKCKKKEVAKFCGGFIADGATMVTVKDRAEYNALLASLK